METSYRVVRWVFRPLSQLERAICTSTTYQPFTAVSRQCGLTKTRSRTFRVAQALQHQICAVGTQAKSHALKRLHGETHVTWAPNAQIRLHQNGQQAKRQRGTHTPAASHSEWTARTGVSEFSEGHARVRHQHAGVKSAERRRAWMVTQGR